VRETEAVSLLVFLDAEDRVEVVRLEVDREVVVVLTDAFRMLLLLLIAELRVGEGRALEERRLAEVLVGEGRLLGTTGFATLGLAVGNETVSICVTTITWITVFICLSGWADTLAGLAGPRITLVGAGGTTLATGAAAA
jgi:hypothetical protein